MRFHIHTFGEVENNIPSIQAEIVFMDELEWDDECIEQGKHILSALYDVSIKDIYTHEEYTKIFREEYT